MVKVGDKIKIKSLEEIKKTLVNCEEDTDLCDTIDFNPVMERLCGNSYVVLSVDAVGMYGNKYPAFCIKDVRGSHWTIAYDWVVHTIADTKLAREIYPDAKPNGKGGLEL